MKCPECGRHIAPRAKFCQYCGKPVSPRRQTPANSRPVKPRWPLYLTLVIAGVTVGALALRWFQQRETATLPLATAAATAFDPTLYGEPLAKQFPAVYAVASQFNCPCNDCNDGIEVCDCVMKRGAAEVRQFIYQLLQIHEQPHVIELVAEKYGNRKNGAATPFKFEHTAPSTWQAPVKQ